MATAIAFLACSTASSAQSTTLEVEPRNCGTYWTSWVDSAEGQNACPDHCEPAGEPLVEEHKSAPEEPTRFRVRNQCFWKPNIGSDMVAKLTRALPDPLPKSCGTHWTDWLDNPESTNPCPDDCGPAGTPVVKTHRSGADTPIQYSVRYACYEGLSFDAPARTAGTAIVNRDRLPPILSLDGGRAGPKSSPTLALTTGALVMTGRRPTDYSDFPPIALTTPPLVMIGRRPVDYSNAPPIALTTPPLVMTGSRIESRNRIPDRTIDLPLRDTTIRKE